MFMRSSRAAAEQLEVREAYRFRGPTYASNTIACALDEELAQAMLEDLPQTHLLDAGCGAGHRIRGISGAMGIDLSPEMLAAGGAQNVVAGDIRAMPFASGQFDLVWCRLVLGYLPDPLPAYREFCRVCMPSGYVFVTDFHPDAIRAGHRRVFKDQGGVAHEIQNYVHTNHADLGAKAGLRLIAHRDAEIGPSVREYYVRGIGRSSYIRDFGLKLVSAYLFWCETDCQQD